MHTSIKHQISDQFSTLVKDCMYIINVVDTTFSYGRALIVCKFLHESFNDKRK